MKKLQNKIAESKAWLQQYYSIVIMILLMAVASSLFRVMTLESQLESCAVDAGKVAIQFQLPKIKG